MSRIGKVIQASEFSRSQNGSWVGRLCLFIPIFMLSCNDRNGIYTDNIEPGYCDFPGVEREYSTCFSGNSELTFDIVTWNLENFPLNGNNTVAKVGEVIMNLNADVVALQEVRSEASFQELVNQLPGWQGEFVDVEGPLDFAFLFKLCEIASYTTPIVTITDMWPRPAVKTEVSHENGLDVVLINIHLKCCNESGDEKARNSSSSKIRNYIETIHRSDRAIVLGDWNDDILEGSPFGNLLDDPNYEFADQLIAEGPSSGWSYPTWDSHLDHILISNELYYSVNETSVVKVDECTGYAYYLENISDHRPVMIRLDNP